MTEETSIEKSLKYVITITEVLDDWELLCKYSEDNFETDKGYPCVMLKMLENLILEEQEIIELDKKKLFSMIDILRMRIISATDCNILEGLEKISLPLPESWEDKK